MAIFSFDNINTLDCENQDLENDVKINKFATLQFRELLKMTWIFLIQRLNPKSNQNYRYFVMRKIYLKAKKKKGYRYNQRVYLFYVIRTNTYYLIA